MQTKRLSNVLLLGANGQVGRALQNSLADKVNLIAGTRGSSPEFDLSKPDSLVLHIRETTPDIVINAAAYTAVDKAESEPDLAMLINAETPTRIAILCAELNIPLIHYSTDYVFDGNKTTPYLEEDTPRPLGVYGETKLAGENGIQASGCQHYIFRTSWVYGENGHNFLKTMLRLAAERDVLSIVSDQFGSPTWSGYLAQETAKFVNKLFDTSTHPDSGVYHLTCSGVTTWFDFAKTIFVKAQSTGILKSTPEVLAIHTDAYPTPAKRPGYSVLNNEKAQKFLGTHALSWEAGLTTCISNLIQETQMNP